MDPDRTLLQDIGIALVVGFFIALGYLTFFGGLLPSWVAGATCAFTFLLGLRLFPEMSDLAAVVLGIVSGTAGGLGWWAVADNTAPWYMASLAGAGAMALGIAIEIALPWLFQKRRT